MKKEIDNNSMWAAFRQELVLQGELQVVAAIDNALNNLGFTIEETSTIIPIPLKQGDKDEEILILKDKIESLHAAINAIKETHRIELEKQGEQKPAWGEDDKDYIDALIGILNERMSHSDEGTMVYNTYKKVQDWVKSLKDRVQPKQEWSEEDINKPNGGIVMEDFNGGNGFYKVNLAYLNEEHVEEIEELVKRWNLQPNGDEDESIISDLLDYFDEDKCLKHEVNDIVKWLKTIKPQQKVWSENEIKMLNNLIAYLDGRKDLLDEIKNNYISWLKSLSPQSHWKPSDEQMEALEHFVRSIGESGYDDNTKLLYSLLSDLKKLREG